MTNDKQRERLYYLFQESKCPMHFLDNKQMLDTTDYLLAQGIIVPPVKVGQTVYLLQKYYGTYCFNVVEDKVQMIGVTSRGTHIKARNHQDHNKMYMLGKTVFLTREEAEAKLKEGVQG